MRPSLASMGASFAAGSEADRGATRRDLRGKPHHWRMLFGNRTLQPGESVLIGGGVAVARLQLAKMVGASVFVTSSSDAKIARAVEMAPRPGSTIAKTECPRRFSR
jgi:hypothetical protein